MFYGTIRLYISLVYEGDRSILVDELGLGVKVFKRLVATVCNGVDKMCNSKHSLQDIDTFWLYIQCSVK